MASSGAAGETSVPKARPKVVLAGFPLPAVATPAIGPRREATTNAADDGEARLPSPVPVPASAPFEVAATGTKGPVLAAPEDGAAPGAPVVGSATPTVPCSRTAAAGGLHGNEVPVGAVVTPVATTTSPD